MCQTCKWTHPLSITFKYVHYQRVPFEDSENDDTSIAWAVTTQSSASTTQIQPKIGEGMGLE